MYVYECVTCDFLQMDVEVIPKLKCNCGYFVDHQEIEGGDE
ncbi:MAG TPA: hypothetical protein VNM45_02535 [Bacillus sp. (in: firmicutes)]|nr:hypothetical protein [Bacillus sp. (in: firmicutes)]